MKFKLKSDTNRRVHIDMAQINAYASRYKPHTWFDVEFTRKVKRKSEPMRKLYFGHALPTYGNHLGYDADEHMLLHRQLKIVWFKVEPDSKGIYRNVPHVFADQADTDVPGKRRFLEWVVRCAARDGCYIDMPGEGGR